MPIFDWGHLRENKKTNPFPWEKHGNLVKDEHYTKCNSNWTKTNVPIDKKVVNPLWTFDTCVFKPNCWHFGWGMWKKLFYMIKSVYKCVCVCVCMCVCVCVCVCVYVCVVLTHVMCVRVFVVSVSASVKESQVLFPFRFTCKSE